MKVLLHIILSITLFLNCERTGSFNDKKFEEKSWKELGLSGEVRLKIRDTNGKINITGTDTGSSIVASITKRVWSTSEEDAKNHIDDIIITYQETSEQIAIIISHPLDDGRDYNVDFDILVPDPFDFDINLVNGDVSIKSATKNLAVDVDYGNVSTDLRLIDTCNIFIDIGKGSITLSLSDSSNATINGLVGDGLIQVTDLTLKEKKVTDRSIFGKLGDGSGRITLGTGNGNIDLKGKELSL